MLGWHERFSRFEPDSELSRLNRDPREIVPVNEMMARFVNAACDAARRSGGLVDPTLVSELERAGYDRSIGEAGALPLADAQAMAPRRGPARPRAETAWSRVDVDVSAKTSRVGAG